MTGVSAAASVVVERVATSGRSRCTTLRSAPPLTLRATAVDTVHLVGTTAGPVGGDDLRLDVRVGVGATLRIASVAASVVLPGPRGEPSVAAVDAVVAPGATLSWAPEPTVLVRGCDHRATAHVRLAGDAQLLWREVVVLGRHDEPSGSLLQRLRVDVDDRPLVRNDLTVGPAWPGSQGPAGVGQARVVATALVVAPGADGLTVEVTGDATTRATVLPVVEGAALVTVVADEVATAVAVLDRATVPRLPPEHQSREATASAREDAQNGRAVRPA